MPDPYQQIQARKDMAQTLLQRADDLCSRLFSEGDLTGFLALLCRLHNYDYRNLLLIYDQYPQATCLGAFHAWKSLLSDPGAMVLKQDAIGKGIDLVASFTEYGSQPYLQGYHVRQFDVSQTNVCYQPEIYTPYVRSEDHPYHLFDAVRAALSHLFQRSLLLVPAHDPAIPSQLSFCITREAVAIRSNTSPLDRIQLLGEAMSELCTKQSTIPLAQHRLFSCCLHHCLMSIWQYPERCPAPQPGTQISSVPASVQPFFLDTLQQSVRLVNETVACAYHYLIYESDDLLAIPELAELWGFSSLQP